MNISVLVGLYNNLEYSKNFYSNFRQIYPDVELIFVSLGSNDGTHEWLTSLHDDNLIYYFENERKTFSDTYNKAVELSTKVNVVFAHNDMIVHKDWLKNITKHFKYYDAVGYTTIEPSIFGDHQRLGKIVKDFGYEFDDFQNNEWNEYVSDLIKSHQNTNPIGNDLYFFMGIKKSVFLKLGGFDNLYDPYFYEDTDFIRRLKNEGYKFGISLDSFVYHFVSKTSRFSQESQNKSNIIENNSYRNYIRKWGSLDFNKKRDICFNIINADVNIIYHLEPWCSYIQVDSTLYNDYIKIYQPYTKINLMDKYVTIKEPDILITFDARLLNQNRFEALQNIQKIINDISEVGEYEFDIFNIKIKTLS